MRGELLKEKGTDPQREVRFKLIADAEAPEQEEFLRKLASAFGQTYNAKERSVTLRAN